MRKLALTLVSIFFTFTLLSSLVSAQQEEEFNYEKAYKDYIYTQQVYKKAHSDYLLARSQYLQARTLTSQSQAREKTVAMLQARDDVVITYLRALRMRLLESPGLDEGTKQAVFSRIDNDIAWYEEHKEQIPSAGTLEDLEDDSAAAAKRFENTRNLAYETLATAPMGKISNLYSSMRDLLQEVKAKIELIRQKGDHNTADTERWVLETENKLSRSYDKQVDAQLNINTLQSGNFKGSANTYYEKVVTALQEANQFLREANSYLQEILREIKTK